LFTFYGRATPDARERIPTGPHAQPTLSARTSVLGYYEGMPIRPKNEAQLNIV
jgi:hypothetical protein